MHNVLITVDVDWAPDWAMSLLAEALLEANVCSTWFITHETSVLDELRKHPDSFELGIHPNFQAGSSHGKSAKEVLEHCVEVVPEARVMRTHCLMQSTPILQEAANLGRICIDSSMYLRDFRNIRPSALHLADGKSIWRLPYVWEDDLEFFSPEPNWDGVRFLQARAQAADEITAIDVHPIHFALNSANESNYMALKKFRGGIRTITRRDADPYVNNKEGTKTFVQSLATMRNEAELNFERRLESFAPV